MSPPPADARGPIYVGFSTGSGPGSRLIRWLTGGGASHVFVAHWSRSWDAWVLLGADFSGGWSYKSMEQFLRVKPGRRRPKHRLVSLYAVPESLWDGLRKNVRWLGSPYDLRGLAGMGVVMVAWQLFRRRVRNPLGGRRAWFCSEIVAQVLRDAGVRLQLAPGNMDPARLERAVAALPGARPVDPEVLRRPAAT